jgi:hypothetical protein
MKRNILTNLSIESRILLFTVLAYLLFLLYLKVGLGFVILRSDALVYWKESLNWRAPFSVWWVPGYPLLIAAIRGITFNLLPASGIMIFIAAVSYLMAVKTVYDFAYYIKSSFPIHLSLLFAFFPFVGLTYSVYPNADTLAIALLLLCILSFKRKQWSHFILFAGFGMITHKALWFFIPPIMFIGFIKYRKLRPWLPLALFPVLIWIVVGAFYHKDLLWFLRWGVNNLIISTSSYPIFDGILTTIRSNSIIKTSKVVVVLSVVLVSLVCLYKSWRIKSWVSLSISLSLILMTAIINSYEIWVVVRFSRLLVIPLSIITFGVRPAILSNRYVIVLVLIFLIASNIFYGFYMNRFFAA